MPAGVDWQAEIPGLRIHEDSDVATQVARGEVVVDSLAPRVLAVPPAPADLGAETDGGAGANDYGDAADGVAADVPDLTLHDYEEATGAQLMAWLIEHGVGPYVNTPLARLREFVYILSSVAEYCQ